jgi:1-acyl-sn-glycerol-3-phosphate acyltransferase
VILLRSLAFQIAFYLLTGVMGILGLPLLLAPSGWVMRFGTAWSAWTLDLLGWCVGLTHEVRGREHLPAGPSVIAMKHQSAWDTLAAPVIFPAPVIVMKRELGWIPVYGWYVLKAGMIAIDRRAGAAALKRMLAAADRARAAGRPIVIFPEGTRTAVGVSIPYQPGVVALYRHLKLPLVPVAVNSGVFWGRRSFTKRPGRIVVEILPPIAPGGDRHRVMAALEAAIEGATARLVAEAALS